MICPQKSNQLIKKTKEYYYINGVSYADSKDLLTALKLVK